MRLLGTGRSYSPLKNEKGRLQNWHMLKPIKKAPNGASGRVKALLATMAQL
jgi:hypothetical protein